MSLICATPGEYYRPIGPELAEPSDFRPAPPIPVDSSVLVGIELVCSCHPNSHGS